ncbi:MAG: pantetheine-phosphate adenylyltransferase [Nanoarchaeota archaeon]|nr:pantetheine-phosphate adenylyltransferase [Nanoarchaeota archaeon]
MKKAIYAFSGDPITYGHIDVIQRVSRVFDDMIVGIGINPDKKYMFNLEERTEMAKKALVNIPNTRVSPFHGLLVDYAYESGVDVIVKGVRNSADFDYENMLHQVGESQKLGLDTHILFAKPELAHISSSVVKAIQKEQGLIHDYVPLHVKQALEERMSSQYILGVTGEPAAEKSYICQRLTELGKAANLEVHNIELDHIGHQILKGLKEPKYAEVRSDIISSFGRDISKEDGSIDRKALGNIVFNDPQALTKLNEIMYTPLLVRLRRELYGKKGLILLNAALIAESDMSYLCNNNVLLIHADNDTQQERLLTRGLSEEQINRRLASQYNFKEKQANLLARIKKDNHGNIWTFDNSNNSEPEELENILDQVLDYFGVDRNK